MSNSYEQNFLIDYPRISELEELIDFCREHKLLYVYGASETCQYLAKYLDVSGYEIKGYVTTKEEKRKLLVFERPLIAVDELGASADVGILLGLSENYQEYVISLLKDKGMTYFRISGHNKREIARCMRPQAVTQLILEVNVCDHCNLKCRNCDHYSNLIEEEHFLDVDEYRKDMERLSQLTAGSLEAIKLVGGEPLLHPQINKIIEITRANFPHSRIPLATNGILLLKMSDEFWHCMAENDVLLHVTEYPLNIDLQAIKQKADAFGVMNNNLKNNQLVSDGAPKLMIKFPFDLSGKQEKFYFIGCHHRYGCCVLRHGKIYACPPMAYIEYFNKAFGENLQIDVEDSLDLYSVKNYKQISEFLSRRAKFCDFCDVKHRYHHGNRIEWGVSEKTKEEYLWD